jgi:hypothetical protein
MQLCFCRPAAAVCKLVPLQAAVCSVGCTSGITSTCSDWQHGNFKVPGACGRYAHYAAGQHMLHASCVIPRCAVQIIEKLESVRVTRAGMPIEVAMTQNFHHLGVLRSIAWGIGLPDPGADVQ